MLSEPGNAGALLCLVALGGLLLAEWRDHTLARWLCKPLASLGFVVAALAQGPRDSYSQAVSAGLVLCALGDVLLIPKAERAFQLGIAAFALGHLAYALGFIALGVDPRVALIVGAVAGACGFGVWRWLSPHVPALLRVAVQVYVAIIVLMVATAFGAALNAGVPLIALAATGFFVSDLSVARDAFVKREFLNRVWGLPLYYAAQLVFASTLS